LILKLVPGTPRFSREYFPDEARSLIEAIAMVS
jgi:hypothetical protein